MDLGTLIIVIICIIIFVVPFVIFNRKNKSASNSLVKKLKEYATSQQYTLEEYENEDELVLGIDYKNRIAFFLNNRIEADKQPKHINLDSFSLCRVNQLTQGSGDESVIKKISLDFIPKSKKEDILSFVLYEESDERRLNNEVQLSRKWVDIFNCRIK